MDSAPKFVYDPLQLPSEEIRLLAIWPGTDDTLIECTMDTFALGTEKPEYNALSYCWGSVEKPKKILCDDAGLEVTESLYAALLKLRKHCARTYLWADAICINQDDELEKAAQVQVMGRIYNHCCTVICDLGEPIDGLEDAIDFAELKAQAMENAIKTNPGMLRLDVDRYEEFRVPKRDHRGWTALPTLLSKPYFRRAWIKQEVLLSKGIIMLCGDQRVKFPKLFRYAQALRKCGMSPPFYVYLDGCSLQKMKDGLEFFHEVDRVSDELLAKRKIRLAELYSCLVGQRVEASDPRDKVYSLLGMASEAGDPGLYASYTESTYTVYHRFTRRLMELDEEHALELLYLAAGPRAGCASWAIDFDEDPYVRRPNFATITDAWKKMPADRAGIYLATDEALLSVDASRFDEATWVSTAVMWTKEFEVKGEELDDWIFQVLAVPETGSMCAYGASIGHALITTTIADSLSGPKLDPVTTEDIYDALHNFYIKGLYRVDETYEDFEQVTRPWADRRTKLNVGRKFCKTAKGYFALVNHNVQIGDEIFILMGGATPTVLRKDKSDGRYSFICDAYVHGIMNGEATTHEDFNIQQIVLK